MNRLQGNASILLEEGFAFRISEVRAMESNSWITDKVDMTGMVSQFDLIASSLAGTEKNHQVISQNIANVNTPGYKTRVLDFAKFMQQVKDGTGDREMLENIPVELMEGLRVRKDGNNVELDQQVGALKKNALLFQTYSHLLASKMATARRAMSR